MTQLDTILETRFHGAVNIRGIRYQILYSLVRAFDLYDQGECGASIRLEGIEDVDLLGFRLRDTYVQVKSAQSPWNWAKLKEPISGFLEVLREDPNCHFLLAVNFQLTGDIGSLARFTQLRRAEQKRIGGAFKRLCRSVGGTVTEADALLSRLQINSQTEDEIWQTLRREIADHFELGSAAADTYLLVLVARFLECAENRKTVTRLDLEEVRTKTGEALSRETEFQAYGRGLVTRVSWSPDAHGEDFYDGKATRPGHVGAEIDVRRATWLERISKALVKNRVCVLRSSSGQGKTALALRYAYESWRAEQTVILRVAETAEQVELIRSYLTFRASLGVPLLLLVDNATHTTRLWPQVVEQCVALGVSAIVAIRTEDWQRYLQRSVTNYEILEPQLDVNEARQLFSMFQTQQRVHPSVSSANWAFERIGEPHLLMEFVYLVTHGCMLEDRLRDQLQGFRQLGEDPAKTEILRRLSLADSLGASLSAKRMLEDVKTRDDGQDVLKSLEGEYLQIENGQLHGLHWVRSHHLARILHEGFPSRAETALAVLPAIPEYSVKTFVSNALTDEETDTRVFLAGLVEQAGNDSVGPLLTLIDGVFAGGERLYFQANRPLFDDAYQKLGDAGPFILSASLMPIVKMDIAANMAASLGDQGANFQFLVELSKKANETPRGLDLVKTFLEGIAARFTVSVLGSATQTNGEILNWAAQCGVKFPEWPQARAQALAPAEIFTRPAAEFATFLLGVFRYDVAAYQNWYSEHCDQLRETLTLETDSLQVKISDQALRVSFFVNSDSDGSPNEQVMRRLQILRAAVPFCERYEGDGIWCLPYGLVPSVDETQKKIPRENLPCDSDIKKNVVFRTAVENGYLPDSYYRYQEAWYAVRRNALTLVQAFARALENILAGRKFDFQVAFENGELPIRLEECLRKLSDPPPQTAANLQAKLKDGPKKFTGSVRNFHVQTFAALQKNVDRQKDFRLPLHNLKDALERLPEMHAAFTELFREVPDYFDAMSLAIEEIGAYGDFADLFEAWIMDPPKRDVPSVLRQIRAQKKQKQDALTNRIELAVAPLEALAISIMLPKEVFVEHPLRYLLLAYSVADPCQYFIELAEVLAAIESVSDIADFFYFMPLWRGARFMEGAFRLSDSDIAELVQGGTPKWETLVPMAVPPQLLNLLPATPFQASRRLEVQGGAQALVCAIETLRERYQRIADLDTGEATDGERRVFGHQYEQLRLLEQRTAKAAVEFATGLRAACATSANQSSCLSCCATFEQLAQTLSSDGIAHVELAADRLASVLSSLNEVVNSLSEEMPIVSAPGVGS